MKTLFTKSIVLLSAILVISGCTSPSNDSAKDSKPSPSSHVSTSASTTLTENQMAANEKKQQRQQAAQQDQKENHTTQSEQTHKSVPKKETKPTQKPQVSMPPTPTPQPRVIPRPTATPTHSAPKRAPKPVPTPTPRKAIPQPQPAPKPVQQNIRTLAPQILSANGCGHLKIVWDSSVLGRNANGAYGMGAGMEIYLRSTMPSYRIKYVVTHECMHYHQDVAFGYDSTDAMNRLNQIWHTSGMMGIEKAADCMTAAKGIKVYNYTNKCSAVELTAARKMIAGQRP